MRKRVVVGLGLWLLGWAYFGFPRTLTAAPLLDRMEWIPELHKPRDMVFNFVYYVVFGVLASKLGAGPIVAVAVAAALSSVTEFSQLFSLSRHPSATDLVVNMAGRSPGPGLRCGVRPIGALANASDCVVLRKAWP